MPSSSDSQPSLGLMACTGIVVGNMVGAGFYLPRGRLPRTACSRCSRGLSWASVLDSRQSLREDLRRLPMLIVAFAAVPFRALRTGALLRQSRPRLR